MGWFREWLVGIWVLAALNLQRVQCLRDAKSSSEAYSALIGTQRPTLVKVYADGCRWCEELAPHYAYLEKIFGDEVELLAVDGRRARRFVHDMGIRSFPELLLFEGGAQDERAVRESSFVGRHDGDRGSGALARFVSEHTGILGHWPGAIVRDVGSESDDVAANKSMFTSEGFAAVLQQPALIAFVSPWMDADHMKMFNGELATSVLDEIGARYAEHGLKVYRVDAADSRLAFWTNTFHCSVFPSVVLSLAGVTSKSDPTEPISAISSVNTPLVKLEFRSAIQYRSGNIPVPRQLDLLLEKCFKEPSDCRDYVESLQNAFYFDSLADLNNEYVHSNANPNGVVETTSDDEFDYQFDEEDNLFGSLRDF